MKTEDPYFARDICVYIRGAEITHADGSQSLGMHTRVCMVNEHVADPLAAAQYIARALNAYAASQRDPNKTKERT